MNKFFIILVMLIPIMGLNAQNYLETGNHADDSYVGISFPLPIVRQINGGTVFRVTYDENCSIEMKGSFEYACKILEEYMPPCLPITVHVE